MQPVVQTPHTGHGIHHLQHQLLLGPRLQRAFHRNLAATGMAADIVVIHHGVLLQGQVYAVL